MKNPAKAVQAICIWLSIAAWAQAEEAATETSFVRLGRGVPGVLYEPVNPGDKARIGIMVMHSGGDYLAALPCTELSVRGYRVLCANNSSSKSGNNTDLDFNQALIEVGLGVQYLRDLPSVSKVVLLGHSGGGALMASYQNIAENGAAACQDDAKLIKCPDSVDGLPAADGLMLLDSNYGLSTMALFSIDPAVTDESTGMKIDPELDLFNPDNGYAPNGSSYGDEFIARFQKAVAERNNQLVNHALDRLEKIENGQGLYIDDEPLTIPGAIFLGSNNKLFPQDTRLISQTRNAWPLLKGDGSVETTIIHSVRVPRGAKQTPSYINGALKTTVRRYLSTFAIRVNDDFAYGADFIRGVDWDSSYTTPISSARGISSPLLAMGMTGAYEYMAAEMIYENASAEDKTIAFVEGATHVFTTCTQCESTPGEFGDTVKTLFDYVDGWLARPGRF